AGQGGERGGGGTGEGQDHERRREGDPGGDAEAEAGGVRSPGHRGEREAGVTGAADRVLDRDGRTGGHDAGEQGPADGAGPGDRHDDIGEREHGRAGGDRLREQHGQQKRRLPQVAPLALGEQEGRVPGGRGGEQGGGRGERLDRPGRVEQ